MLLARLRSLDEVAYVRFASVYRQFRDVSEFSEEVRALLEREKDRPGEEPMDPSPSEAAK